MKDYQLQGSQSTRTLNTLRTWPACITRVLLGLLELTICLPVLSFCFTTTAAAAAAAAAAAGAAAAGAAAAAAAAAAANASAVVAAAAAAAAAPAAATL